MPNLVNKKLVLAVAMTMPGVAFSQALEPKSAPRVCRMYP
jgi:hypothetical protein